MNPKVDKYLLDGCMRCKYGGTPQCKVHNWTMVLETLRSIILKSPLQEELKWGVPCYTFNGKNVLLIGAFKSYCSISFLKGSQLTDAKKLLQKQGQHVQAGRVIKFTNETEVLKIADTILQYIDEAIEIEKNGAKSEKKKAPPMTLPTELQNAFDEQPEFKKAFLHLTPGKQRGYIIFFSAPKKAETRIARIKKYTQQILDGYGFHDLYRLKK